MAIATLNTTLIPPSSHSSPSVYDHRKPIFYGVDESGGFSTIPKPHERIYIAACVADSRLNGVKPPLPKRRPDKPDPTKRPTKLDFRYTFITSDDIERTGQYLPNSDLIHRNPQMITRAIATCNLLRRGFGYTGEGNVIIDVFGGNEGKTYHDMMALMKRLHKIDIRHGLVVGKKADTFYYPVNEADATASLLWRMWNNASDSADTDILFPENFVQFDMKDLL